MGRAAGINLVLFLATLQGCATVVIHEGADAVRLHQKFGVVSITLEPRAQPVAAEVKAFGVLAGPAGFTAGYSHQQFAALDGSCRLVLWLRSSRELDTLKTLLGGNTDVCTLSFAGDNE
jgi:hypothetical protein